MFFHSVCFKCHWKCLVLLQCTIVSVAISSCHVSFPFHSFSCHPMLCASTHIGVQTTVHCVQIDPLPGVCNVQIDGMSCAPSCVLVSNDSGFIPEQISCKTTLHAHSIFNTQLHLNPFFQSKSSAACATLFSVVVAFMWQLKSIMIVTTAPAQ